MFPKITIFYVILQLVSAQKDSPCPEILAYEEGGTEQDRWYGRIKLDTPEKLFGVWLRIELDRPAELLGNWFGETTSEDNRIFVIKNRDYHLNPNRPFTVRFFVKYDVAGTAPAIKDIRLNGRSICLPENTEYSSTTLRTTQLYLSHSENPPKDIKSRNETTLSSRESSQSTIDENCGTTKIPPLPLITYGQNTSEGSWPWHAAIYRSKGITFGYICGGSLISVNHVLTAAHCVTKPKSETPFNEDLFIVYLGKHNLYRLGPNVQTNSVKKISLHPEFNSTYLYNNVAVLRLDSPAQVTNFVRTVCLWEDNVHLNSIVGELGIVVGWGYNENGAITETIKQASMPIVTTESCIYSNPDFFSLFTSPETYCAGFRNGTSSCVGDSGGGMVLLKSNNKGKSMQWQLRGIVSLSAAAKTKIICDTSSYIVFADVAKHVNWIRSAMQN